MVVYDTIRTEEERKNPRTEAGIFSILSFWWLNGIFSAGNKRPLQNEDLFPLLQDDKCKEATEKLERLWNEKITKEAPIGYPRTRFPGKLLSWRPRGEGWRLFLALLKLYSWSHYTITCLLALLCGLGNVLQPLFFSLLLAELLKSSRDTRFAYAFASGICLVSIIRVFASSHFTTRADIMPLRWKSAVVGMIYKKVGV